MPISSWMVLFSSRPCRIQRLSVPRAHRAALAVHAEQVLVQVAAERPPDHVVVEDALRGAPPRVSDFKPRPRNSMITSFGPSGIAVSMRSTEVRRL